jgi:hypothetical protein
MQGKRGIALGFRQSESRQAVVSGILHRMHRWTVILGGPGGKRFLDNFAVHQSPEYPARRMPSNPNNKSCWDQHCCTPLFTMVY